MAKKPIYNKQPLPDSFEWVYIYTESDTGELGYVGRAKNAQRCARRIFDHRRDEWYDTAEWDVAFAPVINRFESEIAETILINKYHPKWNRDKTDWGMPVWGGFWSDLTPNDFSQRIPEKLCGSAELLLTGLLKIEELTREELLKGDWKEKEVQYDNYPF